jgi:O-antigen/teichoic acid export membrane protein
MSTPERPTQPPGIEGASEPAAGRLRGSVISGAMWKAASQITLQLLQLITIIVLSRLLGPVTFGLVGMVTVFASLLSYFTDMAFSAALVQRKELTHDHCVTAFWMNTGAGLALALTGVAIAPLVADFFNQPRVEPLFQVMSLNLFVAGLGRVQYALLMRDMRFRSLELRSIIAGVAGAAVGVGMAFAGFGAWALIGQITTINCLRTALVWVASEWRPTFAFSWAAWKDIRRFSRDVLATNILYFLNSNADNLIVGKFLGPGPLGIYRLSYNMMLQPIYRFVVPIRNVVFPAFSKMQTDRERMLAAWIRVNRIVLGFVLPAVVGLVVTAPDFVDVVFGHRWHGAVPVIMALAAVGVLQSLQRLNDSVMQARNRTGQQLVFAGIALAANLTAFLVGVQFGVAGVAVGAAIACGVVQPAYTVATAHALGTTVRVAMQGVAGVVAACTVMGAGSLGIRLGMTAVGVPIVPRFACEVAAGVAIFAAAVLHFEPDLVQDCRMMLSDVRRRIRRRGGAGVEPALSSK